MLKPGGVTTHVIDLRNHLDFDHPLEFLRYSEWLWRLATSRRPLYTNRWRLFDLLAGFEAAGLEVADLTITDRAEVTAGDRATFAPRFRGKTLEDLSVVGVFMTAVKPATHG